MYWMQGYISVTLYKSDTLLTELSHRRIGYSENKDKLELMFMKHYAPNRCLYIKVAKLRTGVGSAEMSHLQNCSLKIYLKRALGGGWGWGGGGGQDGCERIELKFL